MDRLFDVEEVPTGVRNPVLAFDPSKRTNGERIADLAGLGYLPSPVLDVTFGLGGMWSVHRPSVLVRSDLDPERGLDVVADFTALPFADRSFATVVFDPPYKTSGGAPTMGGGHVDLAGRFGVNQTRTNDSVLGLIVGGVAECCRVASSFVVVKAQDQTSGGRLVHQTVVVSVAAEAAGWRVVDLLHLANTIPSPAATQRSVRKNFSTFLVLGL